MNKAILIGRMTRDPESKNYGEDKMKVNFTIAVDKRKKKGVEQEADFINLTAWGKPAEIIETYARKGQQIMVEARIENNNYEKDGVKHYSFNFIVQEFEFLGSKKDNQSPDKQAVETMAGVDSAFKSSNEESPF